MIRLQRVLTVLLCLLFFLLGTHDSWAVTLRPSFFDLPVVKGQKLTKTVTVTNDSKQPLQFLLEASDVRFSKAGTPQFLGSSHIPADSLLWWLTFDKGPYTVAPGQSQDVDVAFAIPTDVDPGGHYGALLVTPLTASEKDQTTAIGLESKLASLLFADVAGTAYRHFTITQFGSQQSLYAAPSVSFTLLLTNDGVTHLQPHGTLSITNDMTHEEVGRVAINEDFHYMLPKTSQQMQLQWQDQQSISWWPKYLGKYTATVDIAAAHAPSQTAQVTFWVVPVTFLAGAAGLGVLLIMVLAGYTWYIIRRHAKS